MMREHREASEKYSLRGQVFASIREDILNGRFTNGEGLKETTISKELGVSRTPVREAIRQLELEGLVKSIPNKGVIVAGISKEDVLDIFDIRIRLEGLACRRAAKNITPDDLKELQEVLDLMEFFISKKDIAHLVDLDRDFHRIIYDASQSKSISHILCHYHQYVQKARITSLEVEGRMQQVWQEHMEIYRSLAEGNEEQAEKAMTEHVQNAYKNFIQNTPA